MITVSTYAQLAQDSYSTSYPNYPVGWMAVQGSVEMPDGFTGNAFWSKSDNTLVIGYGGTYNRQDAISDAIMAVTGTSSQEAAAVSFAKRIIQEFNNGIVSGLYNPSGPINIVYVGHSLGGVLAQRAYLSDSSGNAQAVVFNSPGLGGFWGAAGLSDNGVSYYYSDPISWGEPSGPGLLGSLVTAGNVHNLGDLLNKNVYFILQA